MSCWFVNSIANKTGTNIIVVSKAQLTVMVAIGNISRKGCVE
jgi:hypothetical protein